MHEAIVKAPAALENLHRLFVVAHVFLHAEIRCPQVEMQRRAHAHRRQIRGAVAAGTYLIEGGQIGNAAQMRDAAGVGNGHADVVDQLFLNQLLAVPDRVEHFADGNRRHGVLTDQAEGFLVFCRGRVFQPEQAVFFNRLAQPRGFNGRQAVVHIVQQMRLETEFFAHGSKQFGDVIEIFFGRPGLFFRPAFGRGFVSAALGDAIDRFHARYAALRTNRLEAFFLIFGKGLQGFRDVATRGVAIDHHVFARGTAQQLIDRQIGDFSLDVPQCHIDRANRRHGHRAAPPVSAFIEVLPYIFNFLRIAANQQRADMILQIRGDGKLTTIQCGVTYPCKSFICRDFKSNEVASGATYDNFCANNFHRFSFV